VVILTGHRHRRLVPQGQGYRARRHQNPLPGQHWLLAEPTLAPRRRFEDAELRRLDPATALAQTEMLLSAVRLDDLSEERRTSSGFVEQQRLFARARR